MASKESSSMSLLEADMWKLRREMQNLQAEVAETIGELHQILHVLRNLSYPESRLSGRFDLPLDNRKKLN
jgi:hypothetical protein